MHKQILFNSIKIQQTHKCPVIYIITSINMDHGIYPPGFSAPFPANLDFYYWITSLFITFDNIWQEKDQVKPLIVFTIILKWVTAVFRAHNHSTVYADIITLREFTQVIFKKSGCPNCSSTPQFSEFNVYFSSVEKWTSRVSNGFAA
jgi:hypothetical protein